MNVPDRFDMFYLPPGSYLPFNQKIIFIFFLKKLKKKFLNCQTISSQKMKLHRIQKCKMRQLLRYLEKITMGNEIRHKLLQEQVIFAGYKVIIRVQTTNETKPEAMVVNALNDLIT